MRRRIDWESRIGRRLRFRDLHTFFTVVNLGSMAKAAVQLGVSTPTVSEVIADLERALGVRLLDRSPRGVEPTIYGRAMLKRGLAAFDELKQGIRDIEFLADPTVGELRIGCDKSIAAATLPLIVRRFSQQYPKVVLDVEDIDLRTFPPRLQEQGFDLVLTRIRVPGAERPRSDELNIETLFDDELVIAASLDAPWSRRRKIDLADLINARWILSAPNTWNYIVLAEAFHARKLPLPEISLKTLSVHLRINLLATGQFVTAFPRSVLELYAERFALKALSVELPKHRWPVVLLTQKGRTLTPIVERFITCMREVLRPEARR